MTGAGTVLAPPPVRPSRQWPVMLGPASEESLDTASLVQALQGDISRLRSTLPLAAFENTLSDTARRLQSTELSDRYLIGHVTERAGQELVQRSGLMYTGYPAVDRLEMAAAGAMAARFGAAYVDFRPLSGLHATMCTLAALTAPGDLVYSIDPARGGHFATRLLLERLGRRSGYLPWDAGAGQIDATAFASDWHRAPGRMVFLDHGTPLRPLDVSPIRRVIGDGATLVYDASHTLGLMAGRLFQDPLAEGCDIVQGNTHKSFPGAHKGVILAADPATGELISAAIGGALVSSQQTGACLANFVTCLEMDRFGEAYAEQMVRNTRTLASALAAEGFELQTPCDGGPATSSHVLLVRAYHDVTGYRLGSLLSDAGIRLNARPIDGAVVVRIGVQEVTRRGMGQAEMARIAELMASAAGGGDPRRIARQVADLCHRWAAVHFSFDQNSSLSAVR